MEQIGPGNLLQGRVFHLQPLACLDDADAVGKEGVGTAERLGKLPVFPGDDEGVGIDRVDEELAFGPALHLLGGTHQFEVSDSHFFANLAN